MGCDDPEPEQARSRDGAPLDLSMTISDAGPADLGILADVSNSDLGRAEDAALATDMTIFGDAGMLPPLPDCNAVHPPVVMAHGLLGSGDTWAKQVQRFAANGHCADRYYAFDWNSLDRSTDHAQNLDVFIDTVRARHETDAVDLVGHSAGGGLGYTYLSEADRAAKVRKYVHIGSFPNEGPAGPEGNPVPTLNLWSSADTVVEGMDIPGATNVELSDIDHYAVATSAVSFGEIYTFLYDDEPTVLEAASKSRSRLQGRLVSLGENTPQAGGAVEAWRLNPMTGARLEATRRFPVSEDGFWGPMAVDAEHYYEFVGRSAAEDDPIVRYFREPFKTDQFHAYVRTFPGPGSIAGVLTTLIPQSDDTSSVVIFNASRAFLAGEDSLTLDGVELLTEASASAENTSIALFLFDIDNDGQPGGQSPLFDMFPFLAAIDVPMPVEDGEFMTLNFNGRILHMPKAPGSEGILVAVFD